MHFFISVWEGKYFIELSFKANTMKLGLSYKPPLWKHQWRLLSGERFLSLRCLLFNQTLLSVSAKNSLGIQQTGLNGSDDFITDINIFILLSWGKLESHSSKRARGLLEVVGVPWILSHFGIQDESHWQVLDY